MQTILRTSQQFMIEIQSQDLKSQKIVNLLMQSINVFSSDENGQKIVKCISYLDDRNPIS